MQVVWKAGCFDITGYGTVARGYILSLDRIGINLKVVLDSRGLPEKIPVEIRDRLYRLIARPIEKPSKTIFIRQSIPDWFERGGCFSLGITTWETSRIHKHWKNWCNNMDALGVPSRMNITAFTISGVHKPVELLRYGIGESIINTVENRDLFADMKMPPFKFLSVFSWIYRKGYDVLIKAFLEEFKKGEGVCLVIKTGLSGSSLNARKYILEGVQRIKKINFSRSNNPSMFFLTEELPFDIMANLYKSCNCFVLPSRGEGACLPLMEAGSLGMPVIATGWGGQTDFLSEVNSYPVEYQLVSVPVQGHCPYYQPDQLWAEPSVMDLRKKMRSVFNKYSRALEKGKLLRSLILEKYTWEKAAIDVVETISKLSGRKVM